MLTDQELAEGVKHTRQVHSNKVLETHAMYVIQKCSAASR